MIDPKTGFPLAHDDRTAQVWLVRDPDDRRAMHDMILIERGDERTLLEAGGWCPERPVEALLALAGFQGSSGSSAEAVDAPQGTPFVRLRGFTVKDPGKVADAIMAARLALAGKLGGFHPVAHGQSGFHRATLAFEHVWNAAGCPSIQVRHPELVEGPSATHQGAHPIARWAELNATLAAVRVSEGIKPGTREG